MLGGLAAPEDTLIVQPADHTIEPLPVFREDVNKAATLAQADWLVTFGIPPEGPETGYGYVEAGEQLDPGFKVRKFKEKPDAATARLFLAQADWLVTFGIPPEGPETGYGYVEAGDRLDPGFKVRKFKEKPDAATARSFLAQGNHYWNSGMFAFRISRFLEELGRHAPEVAHAFTGISSPSRKGQPKGASPRLLPVDARLKAVYGQSPSISIDYAVMEHSDRSAVVPASFSWSDVGSWDVVAELFGAELESRGADSLIAVEAKDNFVLSDLPVALVGVQDLIVVVKNGIVMVCRKGKSQQVRDVVQRLKDEHRQELL